MVNQCGNSLLATNVGVPSTETLAPCVGLRRFLKSKVQWLSTIATRLSAMEFEDVNFDDVEARLLAQEAAETAAAAALEVENDCGDACKI